jgi:hypothetical protein
MIEEKRVYEEYLGDGLYADFDGYHIILSANDRVVGPDSTDIVALCPDVVQALTRYIIRLRELGISI